MMNLRMVLHAEMVQTQGEPERAGEGWHLPEAIQGVQACRLSHVPVELCSRREAGEPKQHLDTMRLVLGAEEDNGAT